MNRFTLWAGLGLALLVPATAHSHELFASVTTSPVTPGQSVQVQINNGTFQTSAGPIKPDKLRDVSFHLAGQLSHPALTQWSQSDTQSRLDLPMTVAGTGLLGISTQPSSRQMSAEEFARYLELEDLPDARASYDPARYPNGVRYSYAKHARAIVQSGQVLTDDYATSFDYPLEIRLLEHPARLRPGQTLTFEVNFRGQPVSGLRVHIGRGASAGETQPPPAHWLRTDAQGQAKVEITAPAIWYIHANRIVPVEQTDLEFVSDRASLTFPINAH